MTTPELSEQLQAVQQKLSETAIRLMDSLDMEAINAAPLNQRAAALRIVLDYVLKFPALSQPKNNEQVIRIEYTYPDGTTHDTPPWTETDPQRMDALQGGRLWTTLRQDSRRQNSGD